MLEEHSLEEDSLEEDSVEGRFCFIEGDSLEEDFVEGRFLKGRVYRRRGRESMAPTVILIRHAQALHNETHKFPFHLSHLNTTIYASIYLIWSQFSSVQFSSIHSILAQSIPCPAHFWQCLHTISAISIPSQPMPLRSTQIRQHSLYTTSNPTTAIPHPSQSISWPTTHPNPSISKTPISRNMIPKLTRP